MKKLIVILFMCMFLCSLVTAFDFDNVKNYNEETRTVTITNAFGLGDTIAEIKLESDLENKLYDLGSGIYQQVALVDFKEFQKIKDSLEEIKTYDVNNKNSEINRDIKLKYRKEVSLQHPIYEAYNCEVINNEEVCEHKIIGYEDKIRVDWIEFNSIEELPNEKNLKIGLYADVKDGDKVEWIPHWFGEEINEWAIWTTGDNALVHYYNFSENDGTFSDSVGGLNPSSYNGQVGAIDGKIGAGYHGNGTHVTDYVAFAANPGIVQGKNFTISLWFNTTTLNGGENNPTISESVTASDDDMWSVCPGTNGGNGVTFRYTGGTLRIATATPGSMTDGGWHHVVVHSLYAGNGDTNATIWVDGVKGGSANISQAFDVANPVMFMLSAPYSPGNDAWEGLIDEVGLWNVSLSESDIADLYNGGKGLEQGDSPAPTVTLSIPEDNYVSNINSIDFGCNVSSLTSLKNITLYIDGTPSETIDTALVKSYNWTTSKSVSEGSHTWNCKAADNSTTITYGWADSNWTIIVDSTPPKVNVSYPVGSIPYHSSGNNLSLNWTINDTNLDSCKFQYNGVNTTLICGANLTSFNVTSSRIKTGIVYSNDTAGNSISKEINWDYYIFTNDEAYNQSSLESSEEGFNLNITYSSSTFSLATARLYYNGTFYSGTRTTESGDTIFTTSVTSPSVNSASYAGFNWEVTLSNSTDTFIQNVTNQSQLVSPLAFAECDGATYIIPFINITSYDEATLVEKNVSFEATFNYGSIGSAKSKIYNFDESNENQSRYNFCVTPADKSIELDGTIKISAANYVDTFYEIDSLILTNTTTFKNLYILNNTDSTSFIIKVIESSYEDVVGAFVHVDRYDVGTGTWLNTEIVETNYEGKAIGHLYTEDADYRFRIWYDGENVFNSSSTKITCEETPCTVTLTIPGEIRTGYSQFDLPGGFAGTLSFDKTTQTFTYTYEDTSGYFTNTRFEVGRRTYGNATQPALICNETKTTTSGVSNCDLSSELNGTYIAIAYLTRTDFDEAPVLILEKQRGMDPFSNIGLDGLLWGFFIFIAIVMLGVYRPSLGILFGIFGVIALFLIKLVSLTITAIASVVIIGLILLWLATRE